MPMNLATRCSTCGTIFRVVQDQLKVSKGWVRCGRCDEVFNAVESLFDLDSEAPPKWEPPPPIVHATPVLDAPPIPHARPDQRDVAELDEDDRIASRFFLPDDEQDTSDKADPSAHELALQDEEADDAFAAEAAALKAKSARPATPAFIRHADQHARSRRPVVRAMVALGCLLLIVTLAGQAVHHFRDTVAARWPATRATLLAWCALARCTLEAPRRIEDLLVDSTTLSRAAPGTDTYRLAVTLRNRGSLPLAVPSLELTLTDGNGQMMSRRTLAPADFRKEGAVIAANTEAPLQMLIATGAGRVSGYTVEVFYP